LNFFQLKKQNHLTEEQLIKSCQEGDKRGQFMLVERYSGKLMTICRRYAAEDAIAKDMLQESLIRIFKAISNYHPIGSFEGWMKTITVCCALQSLHKTNRKKEEPLTEWCEEEPSEPEVYSHLNEEEIIKLVRELPEGYRVVFNLYVIEGYSHQEIAYLLTISESTSRSQLGRARKLLQKKINTTNTNYLPS
jgi:RNA polymerase sigma-70 factor (ECF subfamily)